MGICTDKCVWESDTIHQLNNVCYIFQVNLVDNADPWWKCTELPEGVLSPLEELIAFLIALEFNLHIPIKRIRTAEVVDLNRVINYQIDWNPGIDHFWVATHLCHR